jgi:hypothetical protein
MSEPNPPLAMHRLCELGLAVGAAPINKFDGCWEHQIDERWWIAMNGHKQERLTSEGDRVLPYSCFIKYNGWPAGILDFGGGIIAAGEGANENTFIAALEAAIERSKVSS